MGRKKLATKIKDSVFGLDGHSALYQLTDYVEFNKYDEDNYTSELAITFFVICHTRTYNNGEEIKTETFVYPATERGKIMEYQNLEIPEMTKLSKRKLYGHELALFKLGFLLDKESIDLNEASIKLNL